MNFFVRICKVCTRCPWRGGQGVGGGGGNNLLVCRACSSQLLDTSEQASSLALLHQETMACTILDGLSFMGLRLKLCLQKASWSTHRLPSCWSQAGLQSWEDLQCWRWRRLLAVREIWTHCPRPAEACCTFDRTQVRSMINDRTWVGYKCIALPCHWQVFSPWISQKVTALIDTWLRWPWRVKITQHLRKSRNLSWFVTVAKWNCRSF